MMMYDGNILIFGGRSQNGYLSDFQLIPTDGCARNAYYSEFEEFSGGPYDYSGNPWLGLVRNSKIINSTTTAISESAFDERANSSFKCRSESREYRL